jgi:hypothetical protein
MSPDDAYYFAFIVNRYGNTGYKYFTYSILCN